MARLLPRYPIVSRSASGAAPFVTETPEGKRQQRPGGHDQHMLNPREPAVDRSEQEPVQIPRPLQIERSLTGGEVEARSQRLDLGVEPGPADPRTVGVDRAAQERSRR